MSGSWYTYDGANQEGPFTTEEIQARLESGALARQAHLWRDGMADWEVAETLPDFRSPATSPAIAAPTNSSLAENPSRQVTLHGVEQRAHPIRATGTSPAVAASRAAPGRRGPSPGFLVATALLVLVGGGAFAVAELFPDLVFELSGRAHEPIPEVTDRTADTPKPAESAEATEIRSIFERYNAALQSGDLAALRNLSTKDKAVELESSEAAQMIGMVQAMRPTGITVERVEITGDQATATLMASGQGGVTGTARFAREDGAWKAAGESWEMSFSADGTPMVSAGTADASSVAPGPASGSADDDAFSSPFRESPYERGRLRIRKSGDMPRSLGPPDETFVLCTGFGSQTRLEDPKKAELEFRLVGAKPMSNPRRLELALDATKAGLQRTGQDGVSIQLIADGGQIFEPRDAAVLRVTRPYLADPAGTFSCELQNTVFASAGFEFTVAFTATIEGVPPAR